MSAMTSALDRIEAALPTVASLAGLLDPAATSTADVALRLAAIAAELLRQEQAIRSQLTPELMEQVAQANRDADAALGG